MDSVRSELLRRIGFAVGTGRCGTTFLYRLLDLEPAVAAHHERSPLSDTFHRYCKWHHIAIDDAGFLLHKERLIRQDLAHSQVSFEASAYLSRSIVELYRHFDARFILLIRSPAMVVESYLRKGWYENAIARRDPGLPPSYQESKHFHHFLGRDVPDGPFFERWQGLTRIGKLAWFWNNLNASVLSQFEQVPEGRRMVVRLEDLDFDRYHRIAAFLGFEPEVSRAAFQELADSRPNTNRWETEDSDAGWSDAAYREFEEMVEPVARRFGYPYRATEVREQIRQ